MPRANTIDTSGHNGGADEAPRPSTPQRKTSGRLAVIKAQQSAKSFVTLDRSIGTRLRLPQKQQHVALALMISLLVIVLHVIVQRPPQTANTQ